MNTLHIATLPHGKFLLIGEKYKTSSFVGAYKEAKVDSDTLHFDHYVSISWLVENDIKKVIHL